MASTASLAYTIVDAFTSTPFKGNPAAVLIHPPGPSVLPDDTLKAIARELISPISVFITRAIEKDTIPTFGIRWILPTGIEAVLCGHGTLAAARVMFSDPSIVPAHHDVIKFNSTSGTLLTRRSGDKIEMEFPAGEVAPVTDATFEAKVKDAVRRAFGGGESVHVRFVGRGKGTYTPLILVEIDGDKFELQGATVDTSVFAELLPHRLRMILVTASSPSLQTQYHFRSRTFRIGLDISEDQACGSAHCLIAPYWARKLPGFQPGTELHALQVSERTAEIGIVFDEEKGRCTLRGDTKIVARGEISI